MTRFAPLIAAFALTAFSLPLAPAAHAAQTAPDSTLTPTDLRAALNDPACNNDALAQQVRAWFGGDLRQGGKTKVEFGPGFVAVAWAVEAPGLGPGVTPSVIAEDGTFGLKLVRVGGSDVYAGVAFRPEGIAMRWYYDVAGAKVGGGQIEVYPKNPDETVREGMGIPRGKVTQMPVFHSKVFDGTTRDWWVYVPAQYDGSKPAAVMVFQDGGGPKGYVPAIFDNLIARGQMPVTVGIFINPGKFDGGRSNRSVEYDTVSDAYSQFILTEILPEVEKTVKLSHDPEMRAISGDSSGGICAFTVAWNHPESFRKVVTCVGSFTNLQGGPTGVGGGNTYPAIIRKSRGWDKKGEPKPIRIYMTDGANDVDNAAGSWWLANQEVDRALTYAGYDHKFVTGNGFHGGVFGRFHLSDALLWIWSGPATPQKAP